MVQPLHLHHQHKYKEEILKFGLNPDHLIEFPLILFVPYLRMICSKTRNSFVLYRALFVTKFKQTRKGGKQ